MTLKRFRKRFAAMTMGSAFAFFSLGPPSGCLDALGRIDLLTPADWIYNVPEGCRDGLDNDGDDLIDMQDPGCQMAVL